MSLIYYLFNTFKSHLSEWAKLVSGKKKKKGNLIVIFDDFMEHVGVHVVVHVWGVFVSHVTA